MGMVIFIGFFVSTAHYTLNWYLFNAENAWLQSTVDYEWATYNGDFVQASEEERTRGAAFALECNLRLAVQYLPIINVRIQLTTAKPSDE